MLIPINIPINKYTYTGNPVFEVPWPFYHLESVRALTTNRTVRSPKVTHLAFGTDYTVTGVLAPGLDSDFAYTRGTLTLTASGRAKIQEDWLVVIYRTSAPEQEFKYTELDSFPAHSHENALGRPIALIQELLEDMKRAVVVPIGVDMSAEEYMNDFWETLENYKLTIDIIVKWFEDNRNSIHDEIVQFEAWLINERDSLTEFMLNLQKEMTEWSKDFQQGIVDYVGCAADTMKNFIERMTVELRNRIQELWDFFNSIEQKVADINAAANRACRAARIAIDLLKRIVAIVNNFDPRWSTFIFSALYPSLVQLIEQRATKVRYVTMKRWESLNSAKCANGVVYKIEKWDEDKYGPEPDYPPEPEPEPQPILIVPSTGTWDLRVKWPLDVSDPVHWDTGFVRLVDVRLDLTTGQRLGLTFAVENR